MPTERQASIFESTSDARPLADRMRPQRLEDFLGQEHLLAAGKPLREAIERGDVPSMVFWGPPGSGKTTLAFLIAKYTNKHFEPFSAVTEGVPRVREIIKAAGERQEKEGRGTILFCDEIHRFNKAQQDAFLPWVERGTITLIGATTENPSFELTGALLSRLSVYVLEPLKAEEIRNLVLRALDREAGTAGGVTGPAGSKKGQRAAVAVEGQPSLAAEGQPPVAVEGQPPVAVEGQPSLAAEGQPSLAAEGQPSVAPADRIPIALADDAIDAVVRFADGDARRALNVVEAVLDHVRQYPSGSPFPASVDVVESVLAKRIARYDKGGEEHYNQISALHKAVRGSDVEGALYWLARMIVGGEDPLYVARRVVRMASEDIGLADPRALSVALAAKEAYHFLGSPEGELAIAEAVVYLATAPKSTRVYEAWGRAMAAAEEHPAEPVPLHIRNAPTGLMKGLGYGKGYRYDPAEAQSFAAGQEYLPETLRGAKWYQPTERGYEKTVNERLAWWQSVKQRAASGGSGAGETDNREVRGSEAGETDNREVRGSEAGESRDREG